jgi:hypothetical protein
MVWLGYIPIGPPLPFDGRGGTAAAVASEVNRLRLNTRTPAADAGTLDRFIVILLILIGWLTDL